MPQPSAFARAPGGRTSGDPVVSILAVAAVTAALGGLLARQADWQSQHVLAGWLAYAVLGGLVLSLASLRRDRAPFGLANQVTLLRAGLVCLVGGVLLASGHAPSMSWSLAALIAAALGLDAVDGWLARRLALVSAFGARFDVEVDALLLLILALLVWQAGQVGIWVLAIAGLRYSFVLAGLAQPWLRAPLYPSYRRKAICVHQGLTLLVCLLPPVPRQLATTLAALALGTSVLSFARDIHWLARRRGTTSAIAGE